MNATVIASSAADAKAADAIREHHAQLAGALTLAVAAVLTRAEHASPAESGQAAADLATWCERELLPHAHAEEQTLYATARSTEQARLLVAAMTAEHQVLAGLVRELASPQATPTAAVAAAGALQVLFHSHLAKENDLLVPLLESAPEISLADLLEQMHHQLTPVPEEGTEQAADEVAAAQSGHSCDCGHDDELGYPVLDAQTIPHAIRHATIFGALAAVQPGGGLVLLAPHDPLPLIEQVEQGQPGRFDIGYLQRGPRTWRLQFTRRS